MLIMIIDILYYDYRDIV